MYVSRTVSPISRPFRLLLLSSACLVLGHTASEARSLVPMKPSVEVNLDALDALRYSAPTTPPMAPSFVPLPVAAPPFARTSVPVTAMPAPMERKVPVEQPGLRPALVVPAPAPKPVVAAAPVAVTPPPAPPRIMPLPAARAQAPTIAPALPSISPMTVPATPPAALPTVNLPPPSAPIPAPVAVTPPPVPPRTMPLPAATAQAPTIAPALPSIPPLAVPATPPASLPSVNLPPPPAPMPVAAPAPIPAPVAAVKPMPATVLPAPVPPLALPSTSMLNMPSAPPPVLPAPPIALEPRPPLPLPASVTQRVSEMNAAPKEMGIVRDQTVIRGPSAAMLEELRKERTLRENKMAMPGSDPSVKVSVDKDAQIAAAKKRMADEEVARKKAIADGVKLKAEQDVARKTAIAEAAKVKADETAKLAAAKKQMEADRVAEEVAKKKADAVAKKAAENTAKLAKDMTAPAAKKEMPLLQPGSSVSLPPMGGGKATTHTIRPAAPVAPPMPAGLPTLPGLQREAPGPSELPSLTAITGDAPPSSMDVVQPREGVDTKELLAPGALPLPPSLPKIDMADDGAPVVKRELPDVDVTSKTPAPPALKPAPLPVVKKAPDVKKPEVKQAPAPLPAPVVKKEPVKLEPTKIAALPAIPKPEPKPAVVKVDAPPVLQPAPKPTAPTPPPLPLPGLNGEALGAMPVLPLPEPKAAAKPMPAELPPPSAPPVSSPLAAPMPKEPPNAEVANTPPRLTPVAIPALRSESSPSSQRTTLSFAQDKTDLNDAAKAELTTVAENVKKSQASVRVVAYATGTAEQASVARRISLSRALAIRAFLIDKGVNALSINVQALGNQKPTDSADVFVK